MKRLLAEDPGGPVVMLNLLRFAEGGAESYQEYARHLRETFPPRYGGEIIYAGTCSTVLVAEKGENWDAVIIVRYPDRTAFSRMVADPDYQEVTRLRTQALTEAVLQATTPRADPTPSANALVGRCRHDRDLRSKKATSTGDERAHVIRQSDSGNAKPRPLECVNTNSLRE
ncbi:DUF1330 domain-containing protein [Lentzea sp. BCCO 10_0798]|uniref:DUF1330 domain-containing protein n=1 Tax=Lentzea kristufekii TaxID=3095430 RepID=A0ABU4U8F3_9PSEU|nr:DUF1330 domain-containing protein [Lentzea sp. BCCO 10_0798]MDX8056640.1 DUF1330 domain-containing protein [Lentzea sp. BCCO 10_0798]